MSNEPRLDSLRSDLMALVDRVARLENGTSPLDKLFGAAPDLPLEPHDPCGCEESVRLREVLGRVKGYVTGEAYTALQACMAIAELLDKEGL